MQKYQSAEESTQRTLWNGSSSLNSTLLIPRKADRMRMIVTQGAQSQVRKIGPSPVRKGGELSTFPNSNEEPPGKTRDAPTMLATEHTPETRVKTRV